MFFGRRFLKIAVLHPNQTQSQCFLDVDFSKLPLYVQRRIHKHKLMPLTSCMVFFYINCSQSQDQIAMDCRRNQYYSSFAHPREHFTALCQPLIIDFLCASVIPGSKILSIAQFLITSSLLVQYPTASPARYAAPIAVVSTQ